MEEIREHENSGIGIRRVWRPLLADFVVLVGLVIVFLPGLVESVVGRGGDFDKAVPSHVEAHLDYIEDHLEKDFHGYGMRQVLAPRFDIIALSNMSAGLMNIAEADPERGAGFAKMSEELVRRGFQVAPYEGGPENGGALRDHNLYHSHLNLILGVHRHLNGARQTTD